MKLYAGFFMMHLKSQMQYRLSFFLALLGQFLMPFTAFLGVDFLLRDVSGVGGFAYTDILLCFSVVLASFSLSEVFFRGFDRFTAIISNGEFDRILVRPRGVMFQVLLSQLDFTRLGKLVQALIMFAYAIPRAGISWTADKIFVLIFMLAGGVALFSALFIIYAAFCFFTIEGLEFMNIFTDGSREHGKYPLSIYGDFVLKLMTFVVPLACVQVYPLLYILGKTDSILNALAPLGAFAFLIPACLFWRWAVSKYKSTGS